MPAPAKYALDDLGPGVLAEAFAGGAPAVEIVCPREVAELWRLLVTETSERLPWTLGLNEVAANHFGDPDIRLGLGDAFHFQPGHHAHISRKLEVRPAESGAGFDCSPPGFPQGGGPPPQSLDLCWRITARIMEAMTPRGVRLPAFRAAVQRLKYQDGPAANERIFRLLQHSLGTWAALGYQIDRRRELARGFLARRGLRDAFAALGMIPGLAAPLEMLNRWAGRRGPPDAGPVVVEKDHVDSRYFSGLCGARSAVRTELYAGGRWIDAPIDLGSILVLPGKLAQDAFGIPAVLHRVVHNPGGQGGDGDHANLTLLIGAK